MDTNHFAWSLRIRNLSTTRYEKNIPETTNGLQPGGGTVRARDTEQRLMTRGIERVCVIGAGISGLVCALAMAGRGIRVEVLGASTRPCASPVHLEIAPSMLRDLVHLGVGEDCVRTGFAYQGMDVVDGRGRRLFELPTERLAGQRYPAALGICHRDLRQILECAAMARGVIVKRGARVTAVQPHGVHMRAELESGEAVEADIALLAAGAGSDLRAALFPRSCPPDDVGQAWWYALVPRPVDLDRPLIGIGQAGRRAILVPVRHDTAGLALIEARRASNPDSAIPHLRTVLASFAPRLRAVADRLTADTPVALRPARSGLLASPWHRGGVLAVGDCAHALPPHFGQATAQAVEDARVLGELLARTSDRAVLFEAFERRRLERVRHVHRLTATAARWDVEPDSEADLSLLMNQLTQTVAHPS